MKNIKVDLLDYTNIKVLKKACEKPYKNEFKNSTFEKVAYNIINNKKHESVAEHVYFNFDLLGISRLCLQEVVRHRIASYTVESTRFTLQKFIKEYQGLNDLISLEKYFVIPLNVEPSFYSCLMLQAEDFYKRALSEQESGNDYIKYFLHENYRSNLTMTINIRSLFNFLSVRLGNENNNPHFEIKHLANMMLKQVLETEYRFLFERFNNEK